VVTKGTVGRVVSGMRHPFMVILTVAFLLQFGLGMQRTVWNNFLVEDIQLEPDQVGYVESVREIPGLLTAALAAATVGFAKGVLSGLCVLLVSLGLVMYAASTGLAAIIVATLTYSVGFHLFYPLQTAQTLELANHGEKGAKLGRLNSVVVAASLASMGFVYLLSGALSYRQFLVFAALVAAVGAVVSLAWGQKREADTRKKVVFRLAYMPYYVLTFLGGSRRQMFNTFATFSLVRVYGMPVQHMAALLLASNVVSLVTRPAMGKLVDVLGERRILMLNYAVVSVILLAYARLSNLTLLYVLYVLDTAMVGFDVAVSTYLDKIAPQADMAPTLAMGSTVNHISGVLIPTIGGLLWAGFGHSATFLAGATIAVATLLYVVLLLKPAEVHLRSIQA